MMTQPCTPDCPCQQPKLVNGRVHVFSTGELVDYVEIEPLVFEARCPLFSDGSSLSFPPVNTRDHQGD